MGNPGKGWTPERRKKQSEAIKRWKPWKQSTGPKSVEGKERVAANAWRGGQRAQLRELSRMVNAEIAQTKELTTRISVTGRCR